jgi:hypothetical protein
MDAVRAISVPDRVRVAPAAATRAAMAVGASHRGAAANMAVDDLSRVTAATGCQVDDDVGHWHGESQRDATRAIALIGSHHNKAARTATK